MEPVSNKHLKNQAFKDRGLSNQNKRLKQNCSQEVLGEEKYGSLKSNRSAQHVAKSKYLPRIFNISTPVTKGYRVDSTSKLRKSKTRLPNEIGFSINQASKKMFPSLNDTDDGSVSKINEIAEKMGFKLPRSLSQPRHKSVHQLRRNGLNTHESICFQDPKIINPVNKTNGNLSYVLTVNGCHY